MAKKEKKAEKIELSSWEKKIAKKEKVSNRHGIRMFVWSNRCCIRWF